MNAIEVLHTQELARRLSEADAIIEALLSGQIDAVVDSKSQTPVLLSKAQHALRESEERYRRIVETTNEGIWIVDAESIVTFANGRVEEMLGYAVRDLLGKPLFHFLPDAVRARAVQLIERASEGRSGDAKLGVTRKDGSELWALIKMSPIRGTDGRFVGVLAMMTDRTPHKEAEQALRKSEEQYRQIVEATSDGIIKTDRAGGIVFVSGRFAEMLGYGPEELIGSSVFAFMNPAAKLAAEAAFTRRRLGIADAVDVTFRHKDGTDIAVNVAGSPVFDEAGQDVGSLGLVRDVTEQKKMQSQLMVSDRMASVGTLAAGVAHEINNPLAAVVVNLDYIAGSLKKMAEKNGRSADSDRSDAWYLEQISASLEDARDSARRVGLIVRDLKIFSRTPSDEPGGPTDVKATMESSLRMAWNEIRHRARLVKLYGVVPAVAANEARLGQVFLNLVVNAAQAVPEGRAEHNEIRVSTRLEGERVIIEVSDTGAGIPPEILGRIFDAFFTTKEVGVGTGLGLAISQRLVTDMEGELTVRSVVGEGTTFRVALPIARKESKVVPPAERAAAPVRRGRILVVDDETVVARGVERILSQEHDVVTLVAAKDALSLCASGEKFDLILCDLMMPDMTGMDLHRELLTVAPEQADRMIFLTGGAFTAKARQFLSETPKEHLEKPFEPANLRAIVQRYLR